MNKRISLAATLMLGLTLMPSQAEAKNNRVEKRQAQAILAAQQEKNALLQQLNSQLLQAVVEGNLTSCMNLIERGANVNIKDAHGEPALLLAVKENHVKIVKALLQAQANPCCVNREKVFPLMQIILNGDKSVPKELDDGKIIYVKNDSKLHGFLASTLLTSGANIDQQDGQGRSALHFATMEDNLDAVSFLVGHEADLNIRDSQERTPLMYACKVGAFASCKHLLHAKADVNATDCDGQTPLMFAVQKDQPDLVKLMVSKGANVNATDDFGATALKIADALGNRGVSECLRRTGA